MTKKRVKAAVLAFAVVLAGCASAPTNPAGGGSANGTAQAAELSAAAKLAADINAIEAGKATVSGDAVTLTGGVGLETALTVPEGVTLAVSEGVTLDLTAEGAALTLGNGATLTVNGTVNARSHVWEGVAGALLLDRATTINGNGVINLKSKGELLYIGKNQKLTLDGVTLVGLEDNDDSLVMVIDGGALVLKSGVITGNTRIGEGWAAGGGVHVARNGIFTMEGGAVSGNTVEGGKWNYGGGVYVGGEGGATFIMAGGAISGNIVQGNRCNGGGVHVESGATFTMSGGEISGNNVISVNDGGGGSGGGVNVSKAIFTMKGGTISGNRVTAPYSSGGGVYAGGSSDGSAPGTFIMEGGAIFGNATTSAINRAMSGGVDVRYGTFTMRGGRIQGDTDSDGFAKNVGSRENSAALFVWDCAAKWGTGGTYTRGGVPQSGGSDIVPIDAETRGRTNDTLIAIPAQ